MMFMGEEWGAGTPWQFFTDYPDPELAAAVAPGGGAEFAAHGWAGEDVPDPQDPATRDASVLDWAEPAARAARAAARLVPRADRAAPVRAGPAPTTTCARSGRAR